MKKLLIVFLVLSSYLSYGQVTPVKTVKVTSSIVSFKENIPTGTIIIDTGTGKEYLTLVSLAGSRTIFSCSIVTDIKQLDDQIISLTPSTGISVTGTYPSFTIANTGGTVTSVSGTAPIVSTGVTSPVISMAASTASVSGYLTSVDWTIFNAKQSIIREIADEFTATSLQTDFTLTQTPNGNSKVKMYINGIRISNSAYSNSGTAILTYKSGLNNGSYLLVAGDRIQFDYFY